MEFIVLSPWMGWQCSLPTLQVTWEAVNGSVASQREEATSDPSAGTSYVITGLEKLTRYSVFIHATNSDGTGMNSPAEIITTSATGQSVSQSVSG